MPRLSESPNHSMPPFPRTRLIGRDDELEVAHDLLIGQAAPFLTLVGPGGVGKTRLALEVAARVESEFADGVVWVDFAPLRDPAHVPAMVLQACGAPGGFSESPEADLVRFLRSRQVLLLLDNCEHLLPAVGDLASHLLATCPALQILATSRAAFRLRGEQEIVVGPLPRPAIAETPAELAHNEAVLLFTERARAVRRSFALDASVAADVADICRNLDGLPLAIELAAARLRILPVAMLRDHLRQRLPLLDSGPRDAPPRQRSVRDTIAWSYDLLDAEAQALLDRLAVFFGGFTLEAAAAVAGVEMDAGFVHAIDRLAHQSLVRQIAEGPEPRFTMLETIREFGLERLAASGAELDTRQRHAAWFLALAEAAELHLDGRGHDEAVWLARIDAELANIRLAIQHFQQHGEMVDLHRLVTRLEGYWGARPFDAEARHLLETGLAGAPDAPVAVRAAAYYGLVSRTGWLGDSQASLMWAGRGIALARQQDDPFVLGRALLNVGWAWAHADQPARASPFCQEALPIFRALGNETWEALALFNLGYARFAEGDLTGAAATIDEALRLYERLDDPLVQTLAFLLQGLVATAQGNQLRAFDLLRQGMLLARSTADKKAELTGVGFLAGVALARGQAARAARLLGAVEDRRLAEGFVRLYFHAQVQEIVAAVRSTLGEPDFGHAQDQGRQQPWADVLEDALAVPAAYDRDWPTPSRETPALVIALTGRECEVLGLLCQRLTNAEIAERLYLSPRTVESHVSSILAKLGVENRRDAAAAAVRMGLL